MKEYAIYKGEELLVLGSAKECAKALNIKAETVYYYTTNAYRRKLRKRKNPNKCRLAILLDN